MPIFTAGIFLLSGLAVIVPLALHLLHRRQPQPILFGAVRFMRDAISKSRRSRHLTQGLTLLMRCLILLLLALAFSQPFIQRTSYLPAGRRTLLIVLDGSASMRTRDGDRTLFEKSQAWIAGLLEGLDKHDRAAFVLATDAGVTGAFLPIQDHEHLLGLVKEAVCGFGSVDLAMQIRAALADDKGELKNMELHVFSDFQAGSWSSESVKQLSEDLAARHSAVFLNCPSGGNISDAGVTSLTCVPGAIVGDGPYSCAYTLSHTENYVGSLTVRLYGDGQEQDQLTMTLPGAELSERLTGQSGDAPSGAELTGYVSIDADSYELNDRRYYSLARLSGQPAMIVNGSGHERDGFFLARALRPRGASFSHVVPEVKDWSGFLNTSDLSRYAMIFVCNPPVMDSGAVGHLRRYMEAGGMAVLFPGGLGGLTPAVLAELLGPTALTVSSEESTEERALQMTAETEGVDMLTRRIVSMIRPNWPVSVKRRLPLRLSPSGGRRFISYVEGDHYDGVEFMVRCSVGQGEGLVCSLSANRDWSDLPLTPFYFVLVQELARHGAGYRHRDLLTSVGGELAIPLQGGALASEMLKGTDMEGRRVEFPCKVDSSGKMLLVSGFRSPGIVSVELPWGASRRIAVNIPDSEGVLTYWRGDELTGGSLGGLPVAFSRSPEELRRQMTVAGHSFAMSPWLLLGAFVLSMIEVIYANIRSRRSEQPRLVGSLLRNGGGVS